MIKKQWIATMGCVCALTAALAAGCAKTDAGAAAETTAMETTAAAETTQQETTVEETEEVSEENEEEEEEAPEEAAMVNTSVYVWGPVNCIEEDRIVIDNQETSVYTGEMALMIDPEHTLILDGAQGLPMDIAEIKEGEIIYAYVGEAMTRSLPPMTNAGIILAGIPQDAKAPAHVLVSSMEQLKDGSWELKGADDTVWQVPDNCEINPYRTRNRVMLQDVKEGSHLLIWSDDENQGVKIVLFGEAFN